VALGSHGTKATVRLAANTSPEPFSNIALSLMEDVLTFGSTLLMAFHPVVILVVVICFVTLSAWLVPKIVRAVRLLFRRPGRATKSATA
jgi:short subunit fatty acids transporter